MCIFASSVKKRERSVDIEVEESKDIKEEKYACYWRYGSITALRIIIIKFNSQHKLLPWLNTTQNAEVHDQHHGKSFQP